MQRVVEVVIIAVFVAVVAGTYLLIDALVEEAAERGRWGVVFYFAALLSVAVGLLTLAWFATH